MNNKTVRLITSSVQEKDDAGLAGCILFWAVEIGILFSAVEGQLMELE